MVSTLMSLVLMSRIELYVIPAIAAIQLIIHRQCEEFTIILGCKFCLSHIATPQQTALGILPGSRYDVGRKRCNTRDPWR